MPDARLPRGNYRRVNPLDCARCERPGLTRDDFYWTKDGKRRCYCRACCNQLSKDWQAANREAALASRRKYYQKTKRAKFSRKVLQS